ILHRKNVDSTFEEFEIPKHLARFKRPHLNTDPEDIYDKLSLNSDLILSYLHQNYIDIFNIKSSFADFETQFDALESINENFILSDIINNTSVLFESGSNTGSQEARLKEISASLSIRSVLFNFYFNSENDSKSMWMPLFKPFNSKLMEAKLKKKKMARDFVNLAADKISLMNKYLIEMNKELFTEFIPFMQLRILSRRPSLPRDSLTMMLFKPEFNQLFSKCAKAKTNSQQTTENDYENEDLKDDIVEEKKGCSGDTSKGNYEYEDASGLKIEDFNF
ncbi:cell cycle checkpoint RAD17-like, partial [Brachionus plicatilis]